MSIVEIRNSEGETISQGIPKLDWINEILKILRNPYGFSQGARSVAYLEAANLIEKLLEYLCSEKHDEEKSKNDTEHNLFTDY